MGAGAGEEEEFQCQPCGQGQVEEAVASRPTRDPHAPTKAEREAHEATHLPFRSWCPFCIAGRRDNPGHVKRPEEERTVPEVALDYAFVRRQEEDDTLTVLVAKDRDSRALRAWVMRHKGASEEEAVERIAEGTK